MSLNKLIKIILENIYFLLLPLPIFIGNYIENVIGVSAISYLILISLPICIFYIDKLLCNLRVTFEIRFMRLFFAYLLFVVISFLYSLNKDNGLSILILYLLPLIISFFLAEIDLEKYYRSFSWYSLFYLVLLYLKIPNYYFDYIQLNNRFGYYEGDIRLNPNSFSVFIAIISVAFLNRIINSNKIKDKFLYLIPLATSFFLIFETQSRTGLAVVLVVIIIILSIHRTILTVNLNLIGGIVIFFFLFLNLNFNIVSESRVLEADLNGRDNIWTVAILENKKQLFTFLFGNGAGSAERVIGASYSGYTIMDKEGYKVASPHNMYIEIFLNQGVIGLIMFCIFLISLFLFIVIKFTTSKYLAISIISVFIVSGFSGNHMRSYFYIIAFSVIYAMAIQNKKKDRTEENNDKR